MRSPTSRGLLELSEPRASWNLGPLRCRALQIKKLEKDVAALRQSLGLSFSRGQTGHINKRGLETMVFESLLSWALECRIFFFMCPFGTILRRSPSRP